MLTYQHDFICTYKLMDNDNDQEQMYRIQLLQAFDLNHLDDDKMNQTIMELYTIISDSHEFKQIFRKARENNSIKEIINLIDNTEDEDDMSDIGDDLIFKILFKFEYFDLLHRCIVDYLITNTIYSTYMNNLLNVL
jgi:hypothetical protein